MKRSLCVALIMAAFVGACGKGKETAPTVTKIVAIPSAPAGISTVSGNGTVTVKWDAVPGADTYIVYTSQKANAKPDETQKVSGIKGTSYEHKGLNNGTVYYYHVAAVNSAGESPTGADTGAMPRVSAPETPTGVAASGGGGKITVKWQTVSGADAYNIYFSTKPQLEKAKRTAILQVKGTSYEHDKLKAKTMYFYRVSAVNGGGESPLSGETGAMP